MPTNKKGMFDITFKVLGIPVRKQNVARSVQVQYRFYNFPVAYNPLLLESI
jgi:hypothetical protein